MAATSWDPLQPTIRGAGGEIPPIYKFKEAASQSFKAGAVVELVSGQLAAVADGEARILGIAQQDASGTTNTYLAIQVARPGDLIEMRCVDDVATDAAVAASGFSAGQTYAIAVDSNGVCAADLSETNALTEELVFIAPVYDSNGASTTRGIFVLESLAGNLQGGTA